MAHPEPIALARIAALLWAATCTASIRAQPTQAPDHAVARPGCTQEDLPAVEVILTLQAWSGTGRPVAPYLRFEVAGIPPGVDARLDFSPLERRSVGRLARAEWQDGSAPRPAWLEGSLAYRQDVPSMSVEGSYRVCGDGGNCVEGSFIAPWRARVALCG